MSSDRSDGTGSTDSNGSSGSGEGGARSGGGSEHCMCASNDPPTSPNQKPPKRSSSTGLDNCSDGNARIGTDVGIAGAGVPLSMRMEIHTSSAADGITTATGRTVPRGQGAVEGRKDDGPVRSVRAAPESG